jgi:hypothetical protein
MSKISELSDGGALQSTDYLIAVRSGGNVKVQPAGMTFSSATFTTVDINGGTIDNADITVGSGKTFDVSAGTFTLANDQISGDKIEGGTIGSVTITSLTATSADINGGTIDGATLGGSSQVTITDADMNGGTIDNVVIGGTTPEAGTFTTTTTDAAILDAIATTIADTAVDVFVYDTSRDSDGGAWRHRTQHTSWYNETLNTATRGSRREFPAVAVIVAEATQVTIYDGDDPSLPMWATQASSTVVANAKAVTARNGLVSVASYSGYLATFNFVKGGPWELYDAAGFDTWSGVLWGSIGSQISTDASKALVSGNVNDVAMTVLPNAPIDAATGLPVPTIAVATAGGVSVIKDDGTVADSAATSGFLKCQFTGEGIWYSADANSYFATYADVAAGDGFGDLQATRNIASGTNFLLLANGTELSSNSNELAFAGAVAAVDAVAGLMLHQPNYTDQSKGMSALITSTYNTGWMNGDIKLATLSDTDDTDVTYTVLNSTTDYTSEWAQTEDGWTINATSLVCDGVDASEFAVLGNAAATNLFGVPIGDFASIKFEITSYTSGTLQISTATGSVTHGPFTALGVYEIVFQVGGGTANPALYFKSENFAGTIENIEFAAAEPDRSVNGNGLIINGTITKDPVATGADLVAYSGFGLANYLEQPYNSDLDFGTGDFCFMGWVNGDNNGYFFSRGVAGSTDTIFLRELNDVLTFGIGGTTLSGGDLPANTWTYVVALRRSGVAYTYINGELDTSVAATADLDETDAVLRFGIKTIALGNNYSGSLALWRISATAPTAEQIAKIYEDEKHLFQDGAQATLYGASDAVTALAHDEVTDLLHVGTSAGRSVFQGLRRVDNTTDAVGVAISAYDDLVVED